MIEEELLKNKYDEFIKKDFVMDELLQAIKNDEINELYFDWNMFTDDDIKK